MKILFGIWNGQFGYELLYYQAHVRYLVKTLFPNDEIYVASTHPSAVLYGDFAKHIYVSFSGDFKEGHYCNNFNEKIPLEKIIDEYEIEHHIPIGFYIKNWRLGHHNNNDDGYLNLGAFVTPKVDMLKVPGEVIKFMDNGNCIVITPRTRNIVKTSQLKIDLVREIVKTIGDKHKVIISGITTQQYGNNSNSISDDYKDINAMFLPDYYNKDYVNTQCYVLQNCIRHITTPSAAMILGLINMTPGLILCNKLDSLEIERLFIAKLDRFKTKTDYLVSDNFIAEDIVGHI